VIFSIISEVRIFLYPTKVQSCETYRIRAKLFEVKKNRHLFLNMILIFIIAPALVGYAIYALDQNGFFQIKKIDIILSTRADQKSYAHNYIQDLDQSFKKFQGQSLWSFSLQNISDVLKKQKWVKEFRISRSWPSTLEVQIEAFEISLLLTDTQKLNLGLLRPITIEGDLLPEIDSRQAPAKALLRGDVFLKNAEQRMRAIELLKSLPAQGKMGVDSLAEINYSSKEGFWITMIQSDLKIKLGEDQFAMKSARVSQVMDYLEKKNLKARVIDANLSKKVLVRLQQTP
jgi:cell division protein FtsQ